MKLLGYVAEYPDGRYASPYGEHGSIKLFLRAGSVKRYHPKAACIPVYVHPPKIRVCAKCSNPENDHPYRHLFVARQDPR